MEFWPIKRPWRNPPRSPSPETRKPGSRSADCLRVDTEGNGLGLRLGVGLRLRLEVGVGFSHVAWSRIAGAGLRLNQRFPSDSSGPVIAVVTSAIRSEEH